MADPLHIPKLTEEEKQEAESLTSPGARIIHEVVRFEGDEELMRTNAALAWSGWNAGITVGFSFVLEAMLRARLPDQPWREIIAKVGFTSGFILVILGRMQLFTENTLLPIIPLLASRDRKTFGNVCRLWAIVYVANILGAIVFSYLLARSSIFDVDVKRSFFEIAQKSFESTFGAHLLKGILAGWLLALVVWILGSYKRGGAGIIFMLTYIMGLAGFNHIISGSIEVMYLVHQGALSWGQYLGGFMVPVLLGNAIGGVTMVAIANHAQVIAGGGQRKAEEA